MILVKKCICYGKNIQILQLKVILSEDFSTKSSAQRDDVILLNLTKCLQVGPPLESLSTLSGLFQFDRNKRFAALQENLEL